jgi:prevent-host-death family protein
LRNVSVAEAKAQLSALLDAVEQGEDLVITRRGRPVARVSRIAPLKEPIDFAAIDAIRESAPMQPESGGEFMRKLRDGCRY